jgi:hypothetical protein
MVGKWGFALLRAVEGMMMSWKEVIISLDHKQPNDRRTH